jgi:septum formation topological specificity factor MinE
MFMCEMIDITAENALKDTKKLKRKIQMWFSACAKLVVLYERVFDDQSVEEMKRIKEQLLDVVNKIGISSASVNHERGDGRSALIGDLSNLLLQTNLIY